jgi:hypothetical protein
VLLVDNLGYDSPQRVVLSGQGGPYSPVAVDVAGDIAAANGGSLSLWYPADADGSDPHTDTMDDYRSELASLLSVPVGAESIRTDGGRLSPPDLVVRRGADDRLRDVVFSDRPLVPSPGCTTVTAYPHESRQRGFVHRLLERLTF